jgi:transcriptional regulator with XRE-family HTH domain
MTGDELRRLRLEAGVNGYLVARHSGVSRSRLSLIERGFIVPAPAEAERIKSAIEELAQVRKQTVPGDDRYSSNRERRE